MKRALSLILTLTMALCLCAMFTGCMSTGIELEYGDKYSYEKYVEDTYTATVKGENDEDVTVEYSLISDRKIIITLEDDNTGKYEYYCEYTNTNPEKASENYVISGTITFEWAETSDNGIHLFEVKKTYDKKSTEGKTFELPMGILFYSEDVLYFADDDNNMKYIREDSDLYETVYPDEEDKTEDTTESK